MKNVKVLSEKSMLKINGGGNDNLLGYAIGYVAGKVKSWFK